MMNYKFTREQVRGTETYRKSNKIRRTLVTSRNNMIQINHGVNVCMHKGYDKWYDLSNANFTNKEIVKELYESIYK